MKLTGKESSLLIFNGRKYRLNLSFSRVLQVFEVCREKLLTDSEKAIIACSLLVKGNFPKSQSADIFNAVYEQFITIKSSGGNNGKKVVDFTQDAPYIYAGFRQAYGIDLIEQADQLSWEKFIALFRGLPDDTAIVGIMRIRSMPIPVRDKYNGDQIEKLIKLKQYYALISEESEKNEVQPGLAGLFGALKQRAVK
ncbi:MAG TPA: Gp15 family bacteriophage protein [Oscillospiraceae bacterium]|nr:Gp15 family bacteriophage protein [Oscillospiraceae bacterium]